MTNKIYLIIQGDYEGSYTLKAYYNKEDAQEFVDRKNNYVEKLREKQDELNDHYYNCDLGDEDGNGCDICKEYIMTDFSELEYVYLVQELEVT
jgi:hypothetical protein